MTFPDAADLRPTPDRVRETLFNWLGQELDGRKCLDLFAGSGGLGFEALSRGAAEVVMVESARTVHQALLANAEKLGAGPRLRLIEGDALEFVRSTKERFDVIFLDPPYGSEYLPRVLADVDDLLAPRGLVYAESGMAMSVGSDWQVLKSDRAGGVHYYLITLAGT